MAKFCLWAHLKYILWQQLDKILMIKIFHKKVLQPSWDILKKPQKVLKVLLYYELSLDFVTGTSNALDGADKNSSILFNNLDLQHKAGRQWQLSTRICKVWLFNHRYLKFVIVCNISIFGPTKVGPISWPPSVFLSVRLMFFWPFLQND